MCLVVVFMVWLVGVQAGVAHLLLYLVALASVPGLVLALGRFVVVFDGVGVGAGAGAGVGAGVVVPIGIMLVSACSSCGPLALVLVLACIVVLHQIFGNPCPMWMFPTPCECSRLSMSWSADHLEPNLVDSRWCGSPAAGGSISRRSFESGSPVIHRYPWFNSFKYYYIIYHYLW